MSAQPPQPCKAKLSRSTVQLLLTRVQTLSQENAQLREENAALRRAAGLESVALEDNLEDCNVLPGQPLRVVTTATPTALQNSDAEGSNPDAAPETVTGPISHPHDRAVAELNFDPALVDEVFSWLEHAGESEGVDSGGGDQTFKSEHQLDSTSDEFGAKSFATNALSVPVCENVQEALKTSVAATETSSSAARAAFAAGSVMIVDESSMERGERRLVRWCCVVSWGRRV